MNRRLLFFAGTLALYLLFLTRNYFWDGVMFSLQIEQVYALKQTFAVLFHANHLLYSVFGYLLYAGAHILHVHGRAIAFLQIWNVFVGAGVVYRIWTWSEQLTQSNQVALLSSSLFAFGATWWKFATDADPYMIAIGLLLLAVLFAAESQPKLILAAICHVGAMLFHELAIFGYIPILVALWISDDESTRTRWREVLSYTLVTAALTVGCYYVSYRAGAYITHPTLLHWVTNYAGGTDVTHSARQLIGSNLASYGKLLAGGKLSTIRAQWSIVSALSLLVSFASLLWCALQLRKQQNSHHQQLPRRVRWVFWSWLIPYAIFLAWFDPGNAGHKLFLWPPLVLLLTTTRWSQEHAKALTTGVLALATWNFAVFIVPHSRVQGEPLLALADKINRELPKNATVYYATYVPDDWFLDYFAPGRTWRPLTGEATKSESGPTCFDATALEKLGGRIVTSPRLSWRLIDKQHNIRLECLSLQSP